MPLSNSQNRILHVAKAKLKMPDDEYRSSLAVIAGVTSSTELDQAGFEAMMGFFDWMGFKPLQKSGPNYGTRPGMASFAQIELIRVLWREWTGQALGAVDETGLNTWVKRVFKVDSLRFLTALQAPKVITALKAMKAHKARAA